MKGKTYINICINVYRLNHSTAAFLTISFVKIKVKSSEVHA